MAPVVEKLAQDFEGTAVVGKLNVDENEEIAMRYGVMTIPTLIVFKNGEVVKKTVGLQPREDVEQMLRNA